MNAPKRPRRADAQRSHDKVIAQATADFADYGADVSLDDIARRAGVGSATLFRHFPSRHALLAEVIRASIDELHEQSLRLESAADADEALRQWLSSAIDHAARYRGLASSLMSSYYDPGSPLHDSCTAMHAGGARLLERAQRLGSARPDITAEDLFTLIAAVAWSTEWTPDHDAKATRLPQLMTAGLFTAQPTRIQ